MNKIILVGNPNTGKTTLFNTMTKSSQKVSNWHGVTIDVIKKEYEFEGERYELADIPGIYSISGYSKEEQIATDYLSKNSNDLIINICDANNLRRNLILTKELLEHNYKVIIAVNMSNEVKQYDYDKLSKFFGVNIIEIDARKKKSVTQLKKYIKKYLKNKKAQNISKTDEKRLKNIDLDKILLNYKIDSSNPYSRSEKIDKLILNKLLFLPIFLIIMLAIFFITFGWPGTMLTSLIEFLISKFFNLVSSLFSALGISVAIKSFLLDGVFGAISTVVSFVPQIALLMFFLNLLEDTGYMSRVAFMFDGLLGKFGLSGKSLFSLMMGFGCTTGAVMTTRNLPTDSLRRRTALLLPFMSCTAKLPIFLVISSLFFERYKFLFVFLLYILGILLGLLFAIIYKKAIKGQRQVSILEMPKYRRMNFSKVCKDTLSVIKDFLVKVGTLILLFTSILWVLQNFTISFEFLGGQNFDRSILYLLSGKLSWLFGFIGLGNAGIISAILLGLVAKELVVVGLCMINGTGSSLSQLALSLTDQSAICHFSPISAVVFLVFVLLYSPCISALSAIKNEFGRKTFLYVLITQFIISYVISFLVYRLLLNPNLIYLILIIIALDILVHFVIKLSRNRKSCIGECYGCKKICDKKRTKVV